MGNGLRERVLSLCLPVTLRERSRRFGGGLRVRSRRLGGEPRECEREALFRDEDVDDDDDVPLLLEELE